MENIKHIFILAGGLTDIGNNNPWVIERLNKAIELDICNNSLFYCIGGGTYHKPHILDINQYTIYESTMCAKYLINNNIAANRIYTEWSSYDTIGNGFFSFLNFIIPLKLKSIYVITSIFHIDRTKLIFDFFNKLFDAKIIIEYIETKNNMDLELLNIRSQREKNSCINFINTIKSIHTLEEFYIWFYNDHSAYNATNFNKELDIKLCNTY